MRLLRSKTGRHEGRESAPQSSDLAGYLWEDMSPHLSTPGGSLIEGWRKDRHNLILFTRFQCLFLWLTHS